MVVKLRMQRFGRIRKPFYKIVAVDARKARNAQPIEYLGTWDPIIDKNGRKTLRLSEDRVKYWLTVGAQPSNTVAKLLWRINMLPKPPVTYKPKRSIPKSEREFSTFVSSRSHNQTAPLPIFSSSPNISIHLTFGHPVIVPPGNIAEIIFPGLIFFFNFPTILETM